jgi:hypothetical protein
VQSRRDIDIERVRTLVAASGGRIGIDALPSDGAPRFVLDLGYVTAGSTRYPDELQTHTRLVLDLAPRHPFMAPRATVVTRIFHPNVFASGVVCLGAKWLPSEGMDLFLRRIVRLLAFDPLLVNLQSAANGVAAQWYAATRARLPQVFPSDPAALTLGTVPTEPKRVQRTCPHCAAQLRLPEGRSGLATCPRCGRDFEART